MADQSVPYIPPVTFSKPAFEAYARALREEGTSQPNAAIARTLAEEVGVDQGDLFTYESLRNGTARLFDLDPQNKGLPPAERALSDDQIISLFAVDEQGDPIQAGTFAAGFGRGIAPAAGGFAGMVGGAKAGFAMQQPIPPAGPVAIGIKAAIPVVSGIVGMFGGMAAGEAVTEALVGPERPLLPGHTAEYEQGKTAAGVIGFLPTPFVIGKGVQFGAAQYLDNLAKTTGAAGPRSVRIVQGMERLLDRTGSAARGAPKTTLALETLAGAGQVAGAGFAEQQFPGQPIPRVVSEIAGGLGATAVSAPFSTFGTAITNGDLRNAFVAARERYRAAGPGMAEKVGAALSPMAEARQREAVNKIISVLEAEGEDVDAIIERLSSNEISQYLVDADGKPIPLTAGMKAGSPALLAIEASLDQLGSTLGRERTAASQQGIKALRNVIIAMAQTGDQQALQQVGSLSKDIFDAELSSNLTTATDNVLAAFDRVRGESPETNMQLSEKLFDVTSEQLAQARLKERRLWNSVPTAVVSTFMDADGNVVNAPNFITTWNRLLPATPEARTNLLSEMGTPELGAFVKRKTDELGLGANPPTQPGVLTTEELVEMRSLALRRGRALNAVGKTNEARVAFDMADAMLLDLENALGDSPDTSYSIARSYSRSLNDTFTRAFGGKALQTERTGAERIAPELLATRLFQGGNDPTYLRIEQINEIGQFALREELPEADRVANSIMGVTEKLIRNARAAAFDPEAGTVNRRSLVRWMEQNKELLDMFPAVRADLEDAGKANLLLGDTLQQNKERLAELRGQVSFMDILPPSAGGPESPTAAIARALSSGNKRPISSLNTLLGYVESAPEDLRGPAMTGLKSAIVEWATTRAGGTSKQTFSPSAMYEAMFMPLPGSENRVKLSEWMVSKGVSSQEEVDRIQSFLQEMVKLEAAEASGNIGQLVEQAGPILDFYLAITGSAIGTRAQALISGGGGPGSLIAAGKGAETMRRLFSQMPAALKTDVMSEMMRNPELLAAMMRKPRTERESMRLAERISNFFVDAGFAPVRRAVPGVAREIARPEYEIPVEEEQVVPTTPVPPAPAAGTRVAPPPPPAPPAAPAGPPPPVTSPPVGRAAAPTQQTRSAYSALFPSDIVSPLIQSQQSAGILGLAGPGWLSSE
jgi:hypothetical protein